MVLKTSREGEEYGDAVIQMTQKTGVKTKGSQSSCCGVQAILYLVCSFRCKSGGVLSYSSGMMISKLHPRSIHMDG